MQMLLKMITTIGSGAENDTDPSPEQGRVTREELVSLFERELGSRDNVQ